MSANIPNDPVAIQKFYTSRDNYANSATYVGELQRLWYDPITNCIYVSDGVTPGGIPVTCGGGGGTANISVADEGNVLTLTVSSFDFVGAGVTATAAGNAVTVTIPGSGAQGPMGAQGTTGAQGIQGATGTQGTTGAQGTTGTQGVQGTTGAQGIQGLQGLGDRYQTTSTDSLSIATGLVTFTVGTGLSYSVAQDVIIAYDINNHMVGMVTAYDPVTGSITVDVVTIVGLGTYSSWDVNLNGAEGVAGPQGTTGAQGVQGTAGAQGIAGAQGTTGAQGVQGATGAQGVQGVIGAQGIQGVVGTQGVQGITGTASNISVSDEGVLLTNSVSSFNFTGEGVVASNVGNAVTVDVGPGIAYLYSGQFIFDSTTTLTAGINSNTTDPIPVVSTSGFSAPGYLTIGTEIIAFTGKTATTFTGITRGVAGSNGQTHNTGDGVAQAQVTSAGVVKQVLLDESQISNNVTLDTATGNVTVLHSGTYNMQFSVQTECFGNSPDDTAVWFLLNGNAISKSASYGTVQQIHAGVPGRLILTVNLFQTLNANDVVALEWTSVGGTTVIASVPAVDSTVPQSPGVIFTVNRVY